MNARLRRGGQARCKLIRALAPLSSLPVHSRFPVHSFFPLSWPPSLGHAAIKGGDVDRVPSIPQVIPSIDATSFYIHDFTTTPYDPFHDVLCLLDFSTES